MKIHSEFICQQCGYHSSSFLGKCPECGSWNSLVETEVSAETERQRVSGTKFEESIVKLAEVKKEHSLRRSTGFSEFDRVLGGGIVHGSLVLISGDPGIGKSTLLLQSAMRVADSARGPVSFFPPTSAPLTSFEINSSKNGEKFTSSGNEKRAVGIPSSRATRPIEIYDLTQERQKTLIAKGGEGGKGNAKLRDEFRRRPKAGERGGVGEACDITLELKLIADVGLIGLPNAGKSTLLAALTSAKPQIASYPFTTLEPNLGVLDGSQFTVHSSRKGRKEISETVNSEL